jgi:hypothetical protein
LDTSGAVAFVVAVSGAVCALAAAAIIAKNDTPINLCTSYALDDMLYHPVALAKLNGQLSGGETMLRCGKAN